MTDDPTDPVIEITGNCGCGTSGGYVQVDNDPSLQFSGSFTLEAWVKTGNEGCNYPSIIQKYGVSDGWNVLHHHRQAAQPNHGRVRFTIRDNQQNGCEVFSDVQINDDIWHHIVAVRDAQAQQVRLYIDHQYITSTQCNIGEVTGGTAPLRIGGDEISDYYFKGLIDDVAIYGDVLDDAVIEQHYNNGLGWQGNLNCE